MSASEEVWILGIRMTKFGKHADLDTVDLAAEAATGALADAGVTMADIGVLAAGNLMAANAGIGQQLQKQIGQTGIPVYNVANACATGATALRTAIMAVKAGEVRPGDTTIVYGVGGVGHNALQGASIAGARYVIAVDPVEFKRESALNFGATHSVATTDEAQALALELTWGVGADQAIVTMGVVTEDVVSAAFAAIRKRGTVVLTGLAGPGAKTVNVSGFELALFEKRLQGALFGSSNPFDDIPRILDLYRAGKLKLSELITTRYTLDQVNQGYEDMMAGHNIRGVIVHE